MQEQNKDDSEPQDRGNGRRSILVLRLRERGQEGHKQVRNGEDDEEVAEAAQCAEASVHGRVHDNLQEHAQNTENGGCVADGGGGHAEAAGEPE